MNVNRQRIFYQKLSGILSEQTLHQTLICGIASLINQHTIISNRLGPLQTIISEQSVSFVRVQQKQCKCTVHIEHTEQDLLYGGREKPRC